MSRRKIFAVSVVIGLAIVLLFTTGALGQASPIWGF